jgi:anaerobic ribonucleoside-triphosphate reductase activating protein
MLNINRIITGTKVEGPVIRTCIWLQVCSRHCPRCFAKETWSFEPREIKSCDEIIRIISNDKESEGVTFLGGEPLEQIDSLIELCSMIKGIGKSIVLFSGYTIEEIENDQKLRPVLKLIDVLIDGPYVEKLRDFSRPMIGSKNQRFHFLTSRYKIEDFERNQLEIRISPSGKITVNGQGNTMFFNTSKENEQ